MHRNRVRAEGIDHENVVVALHLMFFQRQAAISQYDIDVAASVAGVLQEMEDRLAAVARQRQALD